jgi:hypothetical protein
VKIEKSGNLDVLDNAQFEIFKDIAGQQCPSRTGFSRDFTETDKKGIRGVWCKDKNLNLEYIIMVWPPKLSRCFYMIRKQLIQSIYG